VTILREARVKVKPDTTGFDSDLKARLRRIDASKDGNRVGRSFGDGMSKSFTGGTFARVAATMAAKLTLVGTAAAAAAPGVIHLTAALAPAAAAVNVLPAALLAGAAAAGTFKVATADVGKAVTTGLTGTAEQAKKAMDKLPPAARTFAAAIVDLKPKVDALRQSVAQRFFLPLQDDIKPLVRLYFPLLRAQMADLAGPLGGLGEQLAESARRAGTFAAVRSIFSSTRVSVIELRGSIDPLVKAMSALVRSTAPFLPGLAAGFATLAQRVGAFIQQAAASGRIREAFQAAMVTLRDLGGILLNVGSILRSVFSAATAGGNSLLANFRALTGQVAAFLKSGAGSAGLTSTFQALAALGQALRTSLGAVLPAIGQSVQKLAPAIVALAGPLAQMVVALAPLIPLAAGLAAQLLTKLTPAIAAFAGWLTENQAVLKNFAIAIGVTVVAIKAAAVATAIWSSVQTAAAVATKVWAVGQWLLNAALTANPIGIVVVAIGALVAGVILAYKHSETFRKIVQAAWQGIQVAVSFAWNNVIKPVVTALVSFFRDVIAPTVQALYNNYFKPTFTAIGFVVKAAWVVIQIALAAFRLYLTNVIFPVVRFLYNNVVKPIFSAIGATISFWWNYTAKPIFALAKAGFSALGTAIAAVWKNVIRPVFSAFGGFLTGTVAPAFRAGVAAIKAAWEKVQAAAKVPVSFVVNKVINPLVGGINTVAGKLGVKDRIPTIPGFALGGRIPAYATGGRIAGAPSRVDNRIAPATIPGVGAVKLAGGEFVVNARDTAKALPILRWINDGMKGGPAAVAQRIGRRLTDRPGDGSEGWAFADGGLVGWVKDAWAAVSNPATLIKKPFEAMIRRIPGSGMIRDFTVNAAKKLLNGVVDWIGGAGGKGDAGKAQAFIRAQAGKPYIWASAGPRGYDCSGIVSAAYNILKGKSPYRHTFSTGSLPNGWFREGQRNSPLIAGWSHPGQFPASSSTGHMAGNIAGMAFESRGSRGVVVGPHARGVNQFAHIGAARFARGGVVPYRSYDSGGYLPPGLSLAHNGTGRPEPVGAGDVHFHFHGPVASKQAAKDMVLDAYNALVQSRKIVPGSVR
jgi:hypothetical protein